MVSLSAIPFLLFPKCFILAIFKQNTGSLIVTQYVCLDIQLNLEWVVILEMEHTHLGKICILRLVRTLKKFFSINWLYGNCRDFLLHETMH